MPDPDPPFAGLTVLVAGDLMLDEHIHGRARRLSPEAPVPVVEVQRRTHHPGGAANVAANVASLGGTAWVAGVIGMDTAGQKLREELVRRGIGVDAVTASDGRMSTVKSRVIAHSQQVVRFDQESAYPLSAVEEEALLAQALPVLGRARVCILSDYAKGVLTGRVCQSLIGAARERGVPVVVDPKGVHFGKYAGATVITPNFQEALAAANALNGCAWPDQHTQEIVEGAGALLAAQCRAGILVTRGADGMSLFEQSRPPRHIPAAARQVYDVTGAGDTVVATLALSLAAGLNLASAASLANEAAGTVVSKLGTATATWGELEDTAAGRMFFATASA